MKKVKIMLFSIAIFAIVGVALAFKAKGPIEYCYTLDSPLFDPGSNRFTCPFECTFDIRGHVIDPSNLECYTTPVAGDDPCPNNCEFLPTQIRKD